MQTLFESFLRIALNMSVLAMLILLCVPFLRKRYSARWRYWVWMVIAIRLLIPLQMPPVTLPAIDLPLFQAQVKEETSSAPKTQGTQTDLPAVDFTPLTQNPTATTENNTPAVQPPSTDSGASVRLYASAWKNTVSWLTALPWKELLVALWVLGMAFFALLRAASYFDMRRVLKAYATPIKNPETRETFQEVCGQMGYHGALGLYHCPVVSSPMVCGIRKPILLLPQESYPPQILEMVLRHELVHIMRHDLWYKLLFVAVTTVHWFNPVVHWMAKAADRDLEISCDEAVTLRRDKEFKAQYSQAIFEVLKNSAGRRFLFSTSFCEGKKTMMQRFAAIFDGNKKRRGAATMALILVFALLTGSLVGCQIQPAGDSGSVVDETISEESLAQMLKTATLYEEFCWGSEIYDPQTSRDAYSIMGYGYLQSTGQIENYRYDSSSYAISIELLAEMHNFYFGADYLPQIEDGEQYFSDDFVAQNQFQLELISADTLQNGDLALLYRRKADNFYLRPVIYTFHPATVETAPSEMAADFAPGDTVYQIVTVCNQEVETKALEETVEISNAQELIDAAKRINEGGWLDQFNTYVLTADIDLTGVEMIPIGQNERYLGHWNDDDPRDPTYRGFSGTFDGQGHTISHLSMDATKVSGATIDYASDGTGLFANISPIGIVQNLKITFADVSSPLSYGNTYGPVGILAGTCDGTIKYCSVQGKVSGTYSVGGLAGCMRGYAFTCSADVMATGYSEVGAFTGTFNYGSIEDSTAKGQVIAVDAQNDVGDVPKGVGGFVGFSVLGNLSDCDASVYISTVVASNWVGAFAGYFDSGTITNCTYQLSKAPNWEAIDVIPNGHLSDLGVTGK